MITSKRMRRSTLDDNKSITSELLLSLLTKRVLGSLKSPGINQIDKLACILEGWRQFFIGSQIFDPLKAEAHANGAKLLITLRTMREEYLPGAATIPEISTKIEIIDAALHSIAGLYSEGIAVEGASQLRWMWLANALPADFIAAVKSSNPGRQIGISQGGPLSRFIEAVVPYLTGESPTAKSIATQLKRHRSRSQTGSF